MIEAQARCHVMRKNRCAVVQIAFSLKQDAMGTVAEVGRTLMITKKNLPHVSKFGLGLAYIARRYQSRLAESGANIENQLRRRRDENDDPVAR